MSLRELKKSGITFTHSRYAGVPEIPHVQDVLYALRLSEQQRHFNFCLSNHPTYIENVGLVIAAIAGSVLTAPDESEARKIIARAILDLTADKDKCLFNSAVTDASEEAGIPLTRSSDWAVLVSTCACPACRERALQAGFTKDEISTFI